ncbi:unnamed protein product [Calicophoron daubneyi]|uniref:Leucine-rich repeat flightless-interacting protein 2 n=1 Tax=Calicophoron daubneyi TaxID=300641 RepID=A0AAV2TSP4_CALDB
MSGRHGASSGMSDMGREAEETEVQRAATRQLMQEGRLIRSKELERRRLEEEDGADGQKYQDGPTKIGPNGASRLSSQRSSTDLSSSASFSSRTTDARELRIQMLKLEEKFKDAMMANVQLDNEKQLLRYEVDLLKDKLEDLSDSNASLHKAFTEKKRELAYQKMEVAELNHRLDFARKQIEARDQLLVEHDLVLVGATDLNQAPPLPGDQAAALVAETEEDTSNTKPGGKNDLVNGVSDSPNKASVNSSLKNSQSPLPQMALISKVAAELLGSLPETTLDAQILHLFSTQKDLKARIEKLENDLEAERKAPDTVSRYDYKARLNGPTQDDLKQDLQNVRTQAKECKYRLQEALQRNSALESDIVRLEGQIKRYKTIADSCEQQEAELKQDRRKCQRELREVQTQLDDVRAENARLQRQLDKITRSSAAPSTYKYTSLRHRDSSAQR